MRNRWLALVAWVVATFAAGFVGGLASMNAPDFYASLQRPSWAPPSWLFGPVWTTLYLVIAVAAWLVWRERGWAGARGALTLFVVQLVLNALWTWIFFAWRQGGLALVEIAVLLALIIATTLAFWRVRPLAGALMLPYLAWVAFATALTLALWRMNRTVL